VCGDKISKIRNYYGERRNECEDHRRLGWESRQAQEGRFETLLGNLELEGKTILDVGCGLGNLYGFLKSKGIKADYTGVDILAEMTQDAKLKYRDGCFMCLDIFKEGRFKDGEFDIVFTSGIFNIDLGNNREFLENALKKFFSIAGEAVCFNILDPGSPEKEKGYFYMPPDEAVKIAMRTGPQGMTAKTSANPYSHDYTVICLLHPAG